MPDGTYPNNTLVMQLLEILEKLEVDDDSFRDNGSCDMVL
jgi:hypothetical protein